MVETAREIMDLTDVSSRTSDLAVTALKLGFVATLRISSFTARAEASLKSASVMPAHPSRASSSEVARPIPEPAPVTRANPGTPRADWEVGDDMVWLSLERS